MAVPIKQFTIAKPQFERGFRHGFSISGEGSLSLECGALSHLFISRRFDSAQTGNDWGRLVLDMEIPQEDNIHILAFASDHPVLQTRGGETDLNAYFADAQIPPSQKLSFFRRLGGTSAKNAGDLLLYPLRGRYLWFLIEATGSMPMEIRGGRLIANRQSLIGAFPEIYRGGNEFLERYLSIFSSMYLDLQRQIDTIDRLMDLDTAPDEALPIFADWLGIQVDGDFLPAATLRRLLRDGYALARVKGTRHAVRQIAALFLGEEPILVEQCAVTAVCPGNAVMRRLYGDDPLSVTLLIRREPDERLHSQLLFLLRQFSPMRSRIRLVFLTDKSRLDTHCYLGYNARIMRSAPVPLDGRGGLNSSVKLL